MNDFMIVDHNSDTHYDSSCVNLTFYASDEYTSIVHIHAPGGMLEIEVIPDYEGTPRFIIRLIRD